MKMIVTQNYDELSKEAALHVVSTIQKVLQKKSRCVFVPSSGSTPLGLYKELRENYQDAIDWRRVILFEMDEYLGLPNSHPNAYSYYLFHQLVQPLGIGEYYFFTSPAGDMQMSPEEYSRLYYEFGGADFVINGVGENGHLGFNEPGGAVDSRTRIVELTESTRQANSRFFSSLEEVPTHAVTLGLMELVDAEHHLVLISGKKKQQAVHNILKNKPIQNCPASALCNLENVVFILDSDAAASE